MMHALLLYAWSVTLLAVGAALTACGILLEKRWHGTAREPIAKSTALLGELLCPIAIVSLIYEASLREVFLKDMSSAVKGNVAEALLARDNANASFAFGVRKFHEGEGMEALARKVVTSHDVRIEIPWFEDDGPWKERLAAFAADHRNKITIFIARAESPWTNSRSVTLESDATYGSDRVRRTLALLKHSLAGNPNARVYQMRQCMPSLLIFEYDSTAIIGFYLNSGHSVRNPQMEAQTAIGETRTPLGQMLDREFETLAKCSDAVKLDQ